jgi:hypothetical protein
VSTCEVLELHWHFVVEWGGVSVCAVFILGSQAQIDMSSRYYTPLVINEDTNKRKKLCVPLCLEWSAQRNEHNPPAKKMVWYRIISIILMLLCKCDM